MTTAHTPSLQMTQTILESISDGVFTIDNEWKITSFNRAAEKITGLQRQDAIGLLCHEVFKSDMCETACPLRKTLKNNTPVINQKGYLINIQGDRVPIAVSTAVLKNEEEKLIGGVETFRDLSEMELLEASLNHPSQLGRMVSCSPVMEPLFRIAKDVAASSSTVLIRGETGTGKELMARALHDLSPRSEHPFIALNCGALPDHLLESELFGYKKGAFTGANGDKPGRFALAGHGTLFLDEIGEISPALQVRLLRVLQERSFEPLGAICSEQCHARIIAATHRDLAKMVTEGSFRQDLYYRIHVVDLNLPPLRERREDIELLINQFIHQFNQLQGRAIRSISNEALNQLKNYSWPGNIRELENVVERFFIHCKSEQIELQHLPAELLTTANRHQEQHTIEQSRHCAEKERITQALQNNHYNRLATAKELGIHKTTLYRKMKLLKIHS